MPFDNLSLLLKNYPVQCDVFFQGTFCGHGEEEVVAGKGILHIIKRADIELTIEDVVLPPITQPSILFLANSIRHSIKTLNTQGTELICTYITIGDGLSNPLLNGFPKYLIIPISKLTGFEYFFDLLYLEAFQPQGGQREALKSLMEYFMIRLIRYIVQEQLIPVSIFAGLADDRIQRAMDAIHSQPEFNWTLELLAEKVGMSRTRFSKLFRNIVGKSAIAYLTEWRLNMAKILLKNGVPIKIIAQKYNYSSPSAFSRAFQSYVGFPPKEWVKSRHNEKT